MAEVTTSNSYVTEEEADSYFSERLHHSWNEAFPIDKLIALIMATRLLEHHVTWYSKESYLGVDEIPEAVKIAQMELALILLERDTSVESEMDGFNSLQFQGVTMTVDQTSEAVIPDTVFAWIAHLGSRQEGARAIKRIR